MAHKSISQFIPIKMEKRHKNCHYHQYRNQLEEQKNYIVGMLLWRQEKLSDFQQVVLQRIPYIYVSNYLK